ncbi:MAG: D-amino acid aminotransferase [Coprothermobacterota bacterium]|nr:D-amino acid aminotransferase [Coprothermobacterota bacterium]
MESCLAWLNEEIGPLGELRVSADDRGFLFADGIYEVIRVYGSRPFLLREHLLRLARSAEGIRLQLPFPLQRFAEITHEMIERAGLAEAEVYLQVTRGVAPRLLSFPLSPAPTVLLAVKPPRSLPAEARQRGVSLATVPDDRWRHCDLKSIALLPNVLAAEQAHRSGAYEALFVRDGLVTEGASSNLFLVRQGTLITPLADWRILPGVTRAIVLQLAREEGIPTEERDIPASELCLAQEAFLTSTFREVLPVTRIDGVLVGDGLIGTISAALFTVYHEGIQRFLST